MLARFSLGFIIILWYPCVAQFSQWTSFSTAHGLGDVEVYTIYKTIHMQGHLWFGTQHGATRFDGLWRNFTQTDGLVNDRVFAIAEDDSGNIWFGTERGASIYRTGRFFDGPDTLAQDTVRAIANDNRGGIWFGTANGAFHFDQNDYSKPRRHYTIQDGLASDNIKSILVDNAGNVWFGTDGRGVSKLDTRDSLMTFDETNTNTTLQSGRIADIFQDRQGNLWFAITGGGVTRFDGAHWQRIEEHVIYKQATGIEQDWDGNLWFTTEKGIWQYDGKSLTKYYAANDSLFQSILDVKEDSYRNLWFATRHAGVSRYDGSWRAFLTARQNDSLFTKNAVLAIRKDDRGSLWFGMNGAGVFRFDASGFTQINDKFDNNMILAIEKDSDGTLWFGTRDGGVTSFDGSSWRTIRMHTDSLAGDYVWAIREDRQQNLWFGTQGRGVSRYNRKQEVWTTFTQDSGLVDNTVHAIHQDRNDNLWFGTLRGISRFDGKEWQSFTRAKYCFTSNNIIAIAEDDSGELWFGTLDGGLLRYNPHNPPDSCWSSLQTEHGLADNRIHAIFYDNNKRKFWFGTELGLSSRVDERWQLFTISNSGLPHPTVSSIFQDCGGNGSTNCDFWFGTWNGVVRYRGESFPPDTYIISTISDTIGIGDPTFMVSARDNITHPDAISYRHRILKVENDGRKYELLPWSTFSFAKEIKVSSALGNGVYEIEVQARDSDGNIDPTPALRRFAVDSVGPEIDIISPVSTRHLSGIATIIGTAHDRDFLKYEIDYRAEGRLDWLAGGIIYTKSNTRSVENPDTLALWHTPSLYAKAKYHLRVRAWDRLEHVNFKETIVIVDQMAKGANIGNRGGVISAAFGQKLIEIYIPPGAFSIPPGAIFEIYRIRIISIDADSVDFAAQSDSLFIGYRVSAIDEAFRELLSQPDLKKQGTIKIKDPAIVKSREGERLPTLFYQPTGNENFFTPEGGTVDLDEQTITAPFSGFGSFVVLDTTRSILRKPKADSVLSELMCRPRVFSTGGGEYNHSLILFNLGDATPVTIWIFNTAGRLVRKLINNRMLPPGEHAFPWDGLNDAGENCVSGLYIICAAAHEKKLLETVAIVNK